MADYGETPTTITPEGSATDPKFPLSDFIQKVRVAKSGAFWFRRRRHPDWTDNYTLYRDKVQMNRLTQRQSVNIPLIKSAIKTLLKDIDDPPILYFTNLDNNDQAELFLNEYWKVAALKNKLTVKDIVDKRQVLLFGRSFKAMNIVNGNFYFDITDPQDMLVDRYVDPSDLDSARFVIQQHIYTPLSSLLTNPDFDTTETAKLQHFLGTRAGLIKAEENQLDFVERQKRMASMGVIDIFSPILGETYVELNKVFFKEFNPESKRDEITYAVTAEDMVTLYKSPLEDCIGETADHFWDSHYPYNTWGDETERTDFWSDGVADTLRTLNKVLNSWFSQMVENRTLRNFGMNYFNSSLTDEGFTPQTFEPVPWGWYPIPAGDKAMGDQIMRVEVPDLTDDLAEMNFIMQIAQQASAATTFQEGVQGQQQVTLGEVQLLLANAKQRVKSMAVYYTDAWYDFGLKFSKMLEAAPDKLDDVTLHKKGRLTKKMFTKTISPHDWLTKSGYNVEVRMKSEMEEADTASLQKLQYAKSIMPNNQALDTIVKKKSLDFADLAASEISEVMKEEEQLKTAAITNPMNTQPGQANGAVPPGQQMMPMGGQPANRPPQKTAPPPVQPAPAVM
jgi:hypothetical protein